MGEGLLRNLSISKDLSFNIENGEFNLILIGDGIVDHLHKQGTFPKNIHFNIPDNFEPKENWIHNEVMDYLCETSNSVFMSYCSKNDLPHIIEVFNHLTPMMQVTACIRCAILVPNVTMAIEHFIKSVDDFLWFVDNAMFKTPTYVKYTNSESLIRQIFNVGSQYFEGPVNQSLYGMECNWKSVIQEHNNHTSLISLWASWNFWILSDELGIDNLTSNKSKSELAEMREQISLNKTAITELSWELSRKTDNL